MEPNEEQLYLDVDKKGHLVIPPQLAARYGIKQDERVRVLASQAGLRIQMPAHLAKLYIEPTAYCNLDCRTCIRNNWDEPMGNMSKAVFDRIIEGLKDFSPPPSVFFGGFGEPLFHPDIIDMVTRVKKLGSYTELITNGTLLTRDVSQALVKAGLDMLWVSLDGATPESYSDIRLGAALPQILENLKDFHEVAIRENASGYPTYPMQTARFDTKLGIAFVAMKRNIADLPAIINIGRRYGAERFNVSNVLPYTREMVGEVLYYPALNHNNYIKLNLPGMDVNETTYAAMYQAIRNIYGTWMGNNSDNLGGHCPFIEKGSGSISWDGSLSPCLPLMHNHTSFLGYLRYFERSSRKWAIGNVTEKSLYELWHTPEHLAFRERVQNFDFSPCTDCGSCEFSEKNEEDCFGNKFPTCGGCLWAQGVIQCP
jgi:MoaA/NifB/PqqE/SkfB family radical SAM enzyme